MELVHLTVEAVKSNLLAVSKLKTWNACGKFPSKNCHAHD